ncbi:MAG: 2,3-bisphosphoglycerate-independent phosphoglycerate mutase [Spirosomataceae bacterium]
MNKKVILIILDGWGIAKSGEENRSAIAVANTPYIDSLLANYPNSTLLTSGLEVGLPDGQMGNSEVGHTNLGAGRIVYQDLVKINKAITEGTLYNDPVLSNAYKYALDNKKRVHFIGLVSDGGVHSHIDHLKGLITIAHQTGITDVFVHAFTDGRDCDPKSGSGFLTDLKQHMKSTTGQIASITGRYYAMDRDRRWERVKLAYDVMVFGEGQKVYQDKLIAAVEESYRQNVTDEFIKPIVATKEDGLPVALIEEGDVVINFNFRTDRGREITEVLTQRDFPEYNMSKLNLYYVTLTNYDETYANVKVIFDKDNLENTLGEVISKAGKKQIRIAETEKYPHVTFFFSGGREQPFEGESRILCPSPKVATYDLKPEMSAFEIRDRIVPELESASADFICLNFANADMVGHTGVFEAAVKAAEAVDSCVRTIVDTALKHGYVSLILADHGNSDYMINDDGSPNTQHSLNPVPFIVVDQEYRGPVGSGRLANIAPTILKLMGLEKPLEMNEESLV